MSWPAAASRDNCIHEIQYEKNVSLALGKVHLLY